MPGESVPISSVLGPVQGRKSVQVPQSWFVVVRYLVVDTDINFGGAVCVVASAGGRGVVGRGCRGCRGCGCRIGKELATDMCT